MVKQKHKKGDFVIHSGEIKTILGSNNSFLKNQMMYLVTDTRKVFSNTEYCDSIEQAWRRNKADIDYDKLTKGLQYYWIGENDLEPLIKNSLEDVIFKIRKEIYGI